METRATLDRRSGKSLWQVALGGVSRDKNASDLSTSLCQGRSGMCATATSRRRSGEVVWCAVRPLIALNTSFELQMYPNVSKNSMWYSNT
ncbi:hypothetical protein DY000_02032519 [Brassica cretica]|uniref:Uncharacterized protein n=1 Tax=Brassica cretica TaxID=69181 RepID=A0ABQ7DPS5_BRACR|nr:hypothetical protein DY000_02032519 [Brassica cretica]